MLIPRETLSYDFGDARFDTASGRDRQFLGWVFNQFLYGEVTGIQCGHWLYRAPHLNAASFLAKQASEELSHVRKILRILSLLGEKPAPAHPVIRFLSTGMMGKSWGEHVTLEMALGEGLVLTVFYALADTIDHPEIKKILESAAVEEERHVVFGERETRAWLAEHPEDREYLLASAMIQVSALRKLQKFMARRLLRSMGADHPVLGRFEDFFSHVLKGFESRVELLGLSRKPLSGMGAWERAWLYSKIPFMKLARAFSRKPRLLTSTYLSDPALAVEGDRFHARAESAD